MKINRLIKYRAWNNESKEWKYGSALILTSCIEIIKETSIGCSQWTCMLDTLGEYTGLNDINDKEIYEGDIVLWHDLLNNKYVGEVVFINCCFKVKVLMPTQTHYLTLSNKYKKIGNIYENPELLL